VPSPSTASLSPSSSRPCFALPDAARIKGVGASQHTSAAQVSAPQPSSPPATPPPPCVCPTPGASDTAPLGGVATAATCGRDRSRACWWDNHRRDPGVSGAPLPRAPDPPLAANRRACCRARGRPPPSAQRPARRGRGRARPLHRTHRGGVAAPRRQPRRPHGGRRLDGPPTMTASAAAAAAAASRGAPLGTRAPRGPPVRRVW